MANLTASGASWYDTYNRTFPIVSQYTEGAEQRAELLANRYVHVAKGLLTSTPIMVQEISLYDTAGFGGDVSAMFSANWQALVDPAKMLFSVSGFSASETDFPKDDGAGMIQVILSGADSVTGSDAADLLYGFGGNDTMFSGLGNDTLYAGLGNDLVYAGRGDDYIYGGQGDDHIESGLGADTVESGIGNDTVLAGQDNDYVLAGQGDDSVFGGLGNDTLMGGRGNDTIGGNGGDDLLYGNDGADLFVLTSASGADTVADFDAAAGDRILITAGTTYTVSDTAGGALIAFSGGGSLVLQGLAGTAVTAALFTTA